MQFNIPEAVAVLERTLRVLRAMLEGVSDGWVHGNYGEKTFSPFDVVGHLIHGERTDWMPRARIILEHGEERTFDDFDRYAMYEESKGKSLPELLATFESLRHENLEALQAMWAVHDLNHIGQIAKAQAYQYREAIGPWAPETSILRR